MNPNPYMLPALIVCAAALLGCGAWALLVIFRQPAAGQHARRREPNAEAARFGAYLRGEDPGEQPAPAPEDPLRVLARVRDALLPDAWRPEPAVATFTPADPDATCTDLPAVTDAPQYLAAPQ